MTVLDLLLIPKLNWSMIVINEHNIVCLRRIFSPCKAIHIDLELFWANTEYLFLRNRNTSQNGGLQSSSNSTIPFAQTYHIPDVYVPFRLFQPNLHQEGSSSQEVKHMRLKCNGIVPLPWIYRTKCCHARSGSESTLVVVHKPRNPNEVKGLMEKVIQNYIIIKWTLHLKVL